GIRFEFVNGFSWGELVNKFQEGTIDGLQSVQNYKNNGISGLYTTPIYDLPFAIVTREDAKIITNYAEL
ncbi:hypothetical protein AB4486_28240, partial [Vibrio sp. 10N.222.55.C6]